MSPNDNVTIRLSADDDNQLVISIAGEFPSKNSDLFCSLTALTYGIVAMLDDSQSEIAELGVAYMDELGITFQELIANNVDKSRMH